MYAAKRTNVVPATYVCVCTSVAELLSLTEDDCMGVLYCRALT